MGSLFTTSQHWSSFRTGPRHASPTPGLLLDEKCADSGSNLAAGRRDLVTSAPPIANQAKLLANLIDPQRANVPHLSERLLHAFGSLGRVLAAPEQAIDRAAGQRGIGERILGAREAVLAGQREHIVRTVFDLRVPELQAYIFGLFQSLVSERLHAIFLDPANRYLADERLVEGDSGQVVPRLRPLVSRAIDLGATGIVLAHNHPSGSAEPSAADILTTTRINRSLADLDLRLVDHLIVAGMTIHSMRGAGLL